MLHNSTGNDSTVLSDDSTSDNIPETASIPVSEVSPKDKSWDKHRNNVGKVANLYEQLGETSYSDRLNQCSRNLYFLLNRDDGGEIQLYLNEARFCRVRHCPVCQWRRSLMWRARFFKAIPSILKDYPKARFLFLTLTAKNCEISELRETINWMNKAWLKLSKRKCFPAIGWVKSIEVTKGKDGLSHPHFHIILMVKSSYFSGGNYISQKEWQELWKKSLKINYDPIINIKAIRGKEDQEGIFLALCETLKYSVKEDDFIDDKEWLQGITNQLHKSRAVSLGGIFKQYLSEDDPEDLIHSESEDEEIDQEAQEIIFSWREMVKQYRYG